jgi:hypothetical protein
LQNKKNLSTLGSRFPRACVDDLGEKHGTLITKGDQLKIAKLQNLERHLGEDTMTERENWGERHVEE